MTVELLPAQAAISPTNNNSSLVSASPTMIASRAGYRRRHRHRHRRSWYHRSGGGRSGFGRGDGYGRYYQSGGGRGGFGRGDGHGRYYQSGGGRSGFGGGAAHGSNCTASRVGMVCR